MSKMSYQSIMSDVVVKAAKEIKTTFTIEFNSEHGKWLLAAAEVKTARDAYRAAWSLARLSIRDWPEPTEAINMAVSIGQDRLFKRNWFAAHSALVSLGYRLKADIEAMKGKLA